MYDLIELLTGKTRRLAHVKRYSSFPTIRPENVAEHSFYVALYAYDIANMLVSTGEAVDMGKVMEKAVMHDIGEAVTGDIVRTFKYHNVELLHAVRDAEHDLVWEMLSEDMYNSWDKSKDQTIEGRIVALADLLSVVAYVYEEWQTGNMHMRVVADEVSGYIGSIIAEPGMEMFRPLYGPIQVLLRKVKEDRR